MWDEASKKFVYKRHNYMVDGERTGLILKDILSVERWARSLSSNKQVQGCQTPTTTINVVVAVQLVCCRQRWSRRLWREKIWTARNKRKRTQSISQQPSKKKKDDAFDFNTLDYKAQVASLTDEKIGLPPPPPTSAPLTHQPLAVTSNNNNYSTKTTSSVEGTGSTQVHYYTYEVAPQTVAPSNLYYQQQQHHPQTATKVICSYKHSINCNEINLYHARQSASRMGTTTTIVSTKQSE